MDNTNYYYLAGVCQKMAKARTHEGAEAWMDAKTELLKYNIRKARLN